LWPRSYGLVEGQPEFSDLHNLRPADTNVNSSRGNKFFGDCTLSKVKSCMVPAHQEAAPDTATDFNSWTPPAQVLDCSWILCALVSFYNGRLQAILFLV
jgi:hypothetical protein